MLIWPGFICGVGCGILILSLLNATRFVCHLRGILIYTHLCLWLLYLLKLKILGVYFDRKLIWGHMIDHLTVRYRQRLGALFHVREYLGQSGLAVAYKSFVRPVCEYGCVIFMSASAVHLHKLDAVQKAAERLCQVSFQPLSSCRKASAIGLLCKLLDSRCQQPLQNSPPPPPPPLPLFVIHPCYL